MEIRLASMTHPGKENKTNQDAAYAKMWVLSECEVGVIAVADGMGGYSDGDVAAQTAVNHLDEFLINIFENGCPDVDKLSHSLDEVFCTIHKSIGHLNTITGGKSGTTLTVCVLHGADYVIKNIGDTRCYLISGNNLRQISTDDSWVAEQVRHGLLSESEARKHEKQNLLTRCLGIGSDAFPHSSAGIIQRSQILIICSDGFYKMLEPDEIKKTALCWRDYNDNPLEAVLPSLFERNETDNISLCLLCSTGSKKCTV